MPIKEWTLLDDQQPVRNNSQVMRSKHMKGLSDQSLVNLHYWLKMLKKDMNKAKKAIVDRYEASPTHSEFK